MLRGKPADVVEEALAWLKVAHAANWRSLQDVRFQFADAGQVGEVLIFNIRGHRYRLIVRAAYRYKRLYVKALMTHKVYDRKEWMRWT